MISWRLFTSFTFNSDIAEKILMRNFQLNIYQSFTYEANVNYNALIKDEKKIVKE